MGLTVNERQERVEDTVFVLKFHASIGKDIWHNNRTRELSKKTYNLKWLCFSKGAISFRITVTVIISITFHGRFEYKVISIKNSITGQCIKIPFVSTSPSFIVRNNLVNFGAKRYEYNKYGFWRWILEKVSLLLISWVKGDPTMIIQGTPCPRDWLSDIFNLKSFLFWYLFM